MKQKKGRLILLFSIIFILCIVAGYCYYRYYINNKEETINEINEEINLGDCNSDCDRQCKSAGRGTSSYNYCYTSCMSSCKPTSCFPGSYVTNNGCKPCLAGTYSNGGKVTSCTKCEAGTYSTGAASKCTKCSGITNAGRTACYTCSFNYNNEFNKLTLNYNNIGDVRSVSINNYYTSSITPQHEGNYTGKVYYTDGSVCTATINVKFGCSQEGYYRPAGKTECEKCESGVIAGNFLSGQICCKYSVEANGGAFPQKLSPSSKGNIKITKSDQKCPVFGVAATNNRLGQGKTIFPFDGRNYDIVQFPYGDFMPCSTFNLSVIVNDKVVVSKSADVSSNWSQNKIRQTFKFNETIPYGETNADRAGSSYRDPSECNYPGDGTKICSVYARTCGSGGGQTLYNYCCVDNGTLNMSNKAEYYENQIEKKCPNNYTLLDNVKKENCKIINEEVGSCNLSNIPSPTQTASANVCEDTVNITVDEGKKCTIASTTEKTSFYEITCAKNVTTYFDYGNDGDASTIRTLHKGEGFAFGVSIDTTVNCTYTFIDENFKKAYNSVINRIKKIDSNLVKYVERNNKSEWENYIKNNILNKNDINTASELNSLWNIIVELRSVVNDYNGYEPSSKYNEKAEISIKTKENGKDVVTKYGLISKVKEKGTYTKSNVSTKNLNIPLVSNPKSYILKSSTPRKVVLIPKRSCIDENGKVKTIDGDKCPDKTLDGGNKIYINYSTDITNSKTTYPITIKVEGLGSNNSEINNNKCTLKVEESEYIYRPIDVSNPFISSSWEKGKNWVNEKYDFTKVIHANTWSDNTNRKVVTLTGKEIEEIKKSNARAWKDNNSPYLGLCDRQSEKLQDEITKKLCSMIK